MGINATYKILLISFVWNNINLFQSGSYFPVYHYEKYTAAVNQTFLKINKTCLHVVNLY